MLYTNIFVLNEEVEELLVVQPAKGGLSITWVPVRRRVMSRAGCDRCLQVGRDWSIFDSVGRHQCVKLIDSNIYWAPQEISFINIGLIESIISCTSEAYVRFLWCSVKQTNPCVVIIEMCHILGVHCKIPQQS